MMVSSFVLPEGGFLLSSLIVASLPIMLFKRRARCAAHHAARADLPERKEVYDEDYLLGASVPYLIALQNIYADAKYKGVRFGGPMERVDSMAGRSGKAIGSVWDQIREAEYPLSADEIRRAVRLEYNEFPAESVEWYNYEHDEEHMNAPSDNEENEIGSDEGDGAIVDGDACTGADDESDATNYSLPRLYLAQVEAGLHQETASDIESDEASNN